MNNYLFYAEKLVLQGKEEINCDTYFFVKKNRLEKMESSDEDTFDESNATEDEEEIDEIFEDDEIDEDGNVLDK